MEKILILVLMFGLIVFVHELGHFMAARFFKVKVNEFAIGMGPKLWSKQKGDTLYAIRAFPLGGFCAMEGENGESEEEGSMNNKKPWQKLIIFAAGAIMNFLLAWLLFAIIVGYQGYATNRIGSVENQLPAQEVGLEVDDRIIAIDGYEVERLDDINKYTSNKSKSYVFTVEKTDGSIEEITIQAAEVEGQGLKFGFTVTRERGSIFEAITGGFEEMIHVTVEIFKTLKGLITQEVAFNQMAGIVGVAEMTSDIWDQGMEIGVDIAVLYMINLAALLSVNLGVFNLLPIPALDGGRILFSLIEVIRRKPIDPEKEGMIHVAGFVLLMVLMVVVLYNDLVRLFT